MERCEECTLLQMERECMASGYCIAHEEPPPEEWLPVPSHPVMHQVSTLGRFRNMKCDRGRQAVVKVVTPIPSARGPVVFLNSPSSGRPNRVSALLAEVVLEAFAGPRPSADSVPKFEDGDPTNLSVRNLRWGSRDR